jgi:hypothetical protein
MAGQCLRGRRERDEAVIRDAMYVRSILLLVCLTNYPPHSVILLVNLFSPTSITITTDHTLPLDKLLHKPSPTSLTYLQLPKDLVIMSNHQSYLDWMIIWMIGYLSVTPPSPSSASSTRQTANSPLTGHGEEDKLLPSDNVGDEKGREYHHGSRTIVILLKRSLKWVPVVGWGM